MPDDDLLYFGHMLDIAQKAYSKTLGITRASYDNDENLRLALAHLVQIVGEAARRVSPAGQAAPADIPWREITGMRHKIVHDYFSVDEDVVWEVVTRDLPPLISILETIILPDEG
jgi:uncharacterized protein with HEPN domain